LINDDLPTFEWSSTAGAGGTYALEYALDAGFTTGVQTFSGLAATTFTVGGALADATYYWHTQAFNSGGDSSGYQTTPFSFTLDATAPAIPTLVSPLDAALITDDTPTFDWSATAGPGGTYTLQYAEDAGFTTGVQTFSSLAGTTYTVPGGQELTDGTYYWHVEAVDAATNGSGYQTTPFSFTVDAVGPDVPSLINPPDLAVITDDTPTFDWGATAGLGGTYTLEYATDAAFTIGVVAVPDLADTTYTIPGLLPGGKGVVDGTYYWHVEAVDAATNRSGYQTTPFSFTVDTEAPVPPTLIAPPDLAVISDDTPTFEWSATAGAGGTYTLEYATDSFFLFAVRVSGLSATTHTVPAPLAERDFYWHVEAMDAASNASGYQADAFMFTVELDTGTVSVPVLLTPPYASYTCDTTPTFTWQSSVPVTTGDGEGTREVVRLGSSAQAVTYTLQYGPDPSFAQTTTVEGLAATQYTVLAGSGIQDTISYWHVEAVDGSNHSGYQVSPFVFTLFEAGDVNFDRTLTSADIIYMVNFTFKGGPTPLPCEAASDVNCDGQITSADIIYMVNFVFKGGPPPCELGEMITDGTWSCP
jgi:hypothetical protein